MDKVNQLLNSPDYRTYLEEIETYEKDRKHCGHDLQHFLDVARIGYILVLEHGIEITKEVVYGYGLLHDIGRGAEYKTGEPHDTASVRLAGALLEKTDYTEEESTLIIRAIEHHRDAAYEDLATFEGLMYKADKASRACYSCQAKMTCYWDPKKKNMRIEV